MRPYYQYDQPRPRIRFGFGWTSVVKALIIANAAAFLLGRIIDVTFAQPGLFNSIFGYRLTDLIRHGRFWQPFTCMFVHSGLGHLFFNMLGLFFFGGDVEKRLGRWNFLVFYVVCGLGGAALGSFYASGIVGASAAVYGVLIAFASFNPDARILIFFMFPVRARYVAIAMVFLSVAGAFGAGGNVAHLAHIGGIAVSVLWLWGKPIWGRIGASIAGADMERRRRRSVSEQQDMDRILAKVHREGIHALSAQEKKFMKKMSKHYREP